MRRFYSSHAVTALCMTGTLMVYGAEAAFLVLVLAILEISLSMDNAVVNASVLKDMTPIWQKRFMTWGIVIAVLACAWFFLYLSSLSQRTWALAMSCQWRSSHLPNIHII